MLTKQQANRIYDVLVEHAGANNDEQSREQFVIVENETDCTEYRFIGNLGFGGKFWILNDKWDVNCYREDMTQDRQKVIERTNQALAELHA